MFLTATILILIASNTVIINGQSNLENNANTASKEDFNLIIIVMLCVILCFAIRHANDFYSGQSVTLVPEGMEEKRFRKDVKKNYLSRIEKDFEEMFDQLAEKRTDEEKPQELEHAWCC